MTAGYVPIGNGVGAGWVGGYVSVVAGSLFAQIVRERADGARYVEAVFGANRSRRRAFAAGERTDGSPPGWISR